MKKLVIPFALLLGMPAIAQVAHGGQPIAWGQPLQHAGTIPEVALAAMDNGTLIASENTTATSDVQYGVQRFFNVDVTGQGTWTSTDDGRRICRLILRSPGAVMVSVQFDQFDLAPQAMLYLYNEDRTFFLGGFTEENEQASGDMATAVVPGGSVVIELQEPEVSPVASVLHVSSLTHGYRDIFDFRARGYLRDYWPGYASQPCHNNVICPAAANWQVEKRAVAMFLRPDGGGCTGQLMNNTQTPGIPYFYMASHCYVPTESQWVFYFNYESPTCVGDTGQTTQTMTGATFKAAYYYDDLCLVQLNSSPPLSYNPYYAGWDHSGSTPTSSVAILHPVYDVKKISFDNNAATSYAVLPDLMAPETVKCWKVFWDSGLVESVGSGSALWDQNHRVVGHMYEGAQTCATATTQYSGFAKISEEWDGTTPGTRLRDWLDPANTSTTLNGYDPNGAVPTLHVRVRALLEGPFDGSSLMNGTLRANGLIPLTEPYTALGYVHHGGGGETTTSGVLTGTNSNSIVDWVVIELRDKNNSANVLYTRSALIQRDGDVVNASAGTGDVLITAPLDDYYIAVRHRNHLGVMTLNPQALSTTASLKDFSTGAIAANGGTAAMKAIGTKKCLYAGDVSRDGQIKYTGATNDRDPILARIGGIIPTNTASGYYSEDANMDGVVKYSGTVNDRDIELLNIGGVVPTATLDDQLP